MLCATRRSRLPGSNLMRAEHEPEPREVLVSVLFRAGSRSSRSPAICSRLKRQDGRVSGYSVPCQSTHCVLGVGSGKQSWHETRISRKFMAPYPPCTGWGWGHLQEPQGFDGQPPSWEG